jgi:DNA-binding transcriptional ArsR family regulator
MAFAEETLGLDLVLRALADGSRRRILEVMRGTPRRVGEVAGLVGVSQQAVSRHLKILREAGLVQEERRGTRHLFTVRTDGFQVAREFLDAFWPDRLARLKTAAEASLKERHDG